MSKPGFAIDVVHGDAIEFEADILMIKYAPMAGGLDSRVRNLVKKAGNMALSQDLPAPGQYRLINTPAKTVNSKQIVMVGTVNIFDLDYEQLRQLGHDMLASLHHAGTQASHVATTAHGINTGIGLDEVEAFRSLLLGFADAAEAGKVPPGLEKITIVEFVEPRATLFQETLNKFLPPDPVHQLAPVTEAMEDTAGEVMSILTGMDSFEEEFQKPVATTTTPHVFVAMPFADEFDDQYYLAIRPSITENNVLCVRLDQQDATFTGDIMEQVRERIRTAKLVVALLDQRNPNVYLEVGYAWGVGTPTLLVLHEDEEAPFDVQGARLLRYKRIHKLKEQLIDEMRMLLAR